MHRSKTATLFDHPVGAGGHQSGGLARLGAYGIGAD